MVRLHQLDPERHPGRGDGAASRCDACCADGPAPDMVEVPCQTGWCTNSLGGRIEATDKLFLVPGMQLGSVTMWILALTHLSGRACLPRHHLVKRGHQVHTADS